MSSRPRKPVGTTPAARFFQWVWDELSNRLQFVDSPSVKWSVTSRGISAHAAQQFGGKGQAASGSAVVCVITEFFGTIPSQTATTMGFYARIVGGDKAGQIIPVVKPSALQCPATQNVEGLNVTFTYQGPHIRVATAPNNQDETHAIFPPYKLGDTIVAILTSQNAHYDLNVDARRWQSVPIVPLP